MNNWLIIHSGQQLFCHFYHSDPVLQGWSSLHPPGLFWLWDAGHIVPVTPTWNHIHTVWFEFSGKAGVGLINRNKDGPPPSSSSASLCLCHFTSSSPVQTRAPPPPPPHMGCCSCEAAGDRWGCNDSDLKTSRSFHSSVSPPADTKFIQENTNWLLWSVTETSQPYWTFCQICKILFSLIFYNSLSAVNM